MSYAELTPASILAAAQRLSGHVRQTPLERCAVLSRETGANVHLKLENLQRTGSFKIRGGLNRLATLDAAERRKGILSCSAGNHALGLAEAAMLTGVQVTLVVPKTGSPAKIAALRRYPADRVALMLEGEDYDAAEAFAISLARETGRRFVSGYNDPQVMAGQGTVALEILGALPDIDVLLVPTGGGGLLSGMGLWAKSVHPAIRVIGVQSTASPQMHAAFAAKRLVTVPVLDSLADGLAGNIEPGSPMYDLARRAADEMVLVDEEEIARAIAWYVDAHHQIVEGSGAVVLAALLNGRVQGLRDKTVAAVLTGRNIAAERLKVLL